MLAGELFEPAHRCHVNTSKCMPSLHSTMLSLSMAGGTLCGAHQWVGYKAMGSQLAAPACLPTPSVRHLRNRCMAPRELPESSESPKLRAWRAQRGQRELLELLELPELLESPELLTLPARQARWARRACQSRQRCWICRRSRRGGTAGKAGAAGVAGAGRVGSFERGGEWGGGGVRGIGALSRRDGARIVFRQYICRFPQCWRMRPVATAASLLLDRDKTQTRAWLSLL